jgi:ABC-type transport system involved in multi-copper enzyme maturation permease subunit
VSRPIFLATIRWWLTSPIRLVVLAATALFPVLGSVLSQGRLPSASGASTLALVLGAGIIGQSVSAGTLPLVLARPIRRSTFVLTRWLAVGCAAVTVFAGSAFVAWLLGSVAGMETRSPGDVALLLSESVLHAFGTAAVLVALSALVRGYGDVALWVVGTILASLTAYAGQAKDIAALSWIGKQTLDFLHPWVDLQQVIGARPVPLSGLAAWAFTVTLCLALAIVFLNRKELSYASSGA